MFRVCLLSIALSAAIPLSASAQDAGPASPDAGAPDTSVSTDGGVATPSAPPPLPQSPAPLPEPPPPPPEPTQVTVVQARRPISAASSFSVRDRDFELRPIASVQDILRVTPGLVLVQHSGGGKANQY